LAEAKEWKEIVNWGRDR